MIRHGRLRRPSACGMGDGADTEASTYDGKHGAELDVWKHGVLQTSFTVPEDAKEGDTFNLVLEVTDEGAPALTRYAQVIVTVDKAAEDSATKRG